MSSIQLVYFLWDKPSGKDIAMFGTVLDGVVLYPCDAVSTEKLAEAAAGQKGIVYIRTTRNPTPTIYAYNCQRKLGKIFLIDTVAAFIQRKNLGIDAF